MFLYTYTPIYWFFAGLSNQFNSKVTQEYQLPTSSQVSVLLPPIIIQTCAQIVLNPL